MVIDMNNSDENYEHKLRSKDPNQNRVNVDYFIA